MSYLLTLAIGHGLRMQGLLVRFINVSLCLHDHVHTARAASQVFGVPVLLLCAYPISINNNNIAFCPKRWCGLWMCSAGPWMGSLGLSIEFFFFLCFLIWFTEAGRKPPGLRSLLTVNFGLKWLQKPPRLILFTRLHFIVVMKCGMHKLAAF